MNKLQPATITATLASGSTATPYYYQCNITQTLCNKSCADSTPVFAPAFSLKGVSNVGTNQYVATIHVEGIISYIPCGGGCCCTKQQPLSQDFTISIYSTTAPTSVTITQGASVNAIATASCQNCGNTFVSETPLSVAVSAA